MAQTIKIKRSTGSSAPATLAQGELAYSKGSDTLYVGDPAAANTPIAVGGAIKNNAGSPVLATGVTATEIQQLLNLEVGVDIDAAGTDNSTNVTLAGTPDYITISGQTITRNLINLTTDVTGDLPIAEGGTGASTAEAARTNLGVDAAGTDNSTDVTLAGTPDYITISGQTITRNQINLTTDVTGDLPIADGGTGSSTASGARSNLGLGALATLSAVGASEITDNSVGAAELNVSGNGTSGQALVSDGDGTFSWTTISVTDNDVSVANLQTRLGEISSNTTIGDATDVTITTSGDLVVTGDLTVSGTTTTVNSETLTVDDNIVVLNNNVTGTPTENAGIEIERGTSANVLVRWNESSDRWEFTNNGTNYYNIPLSTEYTNNAGTVTSVSGTGTVNGISLSGTVTSSGSLTLGGTLSGITVSQLAGAAVQTSGEGFSDIDTALMTAAAIEDRILSKGYTTNVGDITSVQISSTDGSISGVGTGSTGAISFDLEVATIDGGTY